MYKCCICPSLCLTLLCRPLCRLVCPHMYTCLCVCGHFSISTSPAVIFLFFHSQNDSNCILYVLFFRGRWLTKDKMLMSKEREDLWVKSFFFLNLGEKIKNFTSFKLKKGGYLKEDFAICLNMYKSKWEPHISLL